jgi:hypothetical protein
MSSRATLPRTRPNSQSAAFAAKQQGQPDARPPRLFARRRRSRRNQQIVEVEPITLDGKGRPKHRMKRRRPVAEARSTQEANMFIAIKHDIHDPRSFQARAEDVFPLPEGLWLHHFLPADDLSEAVCLYEAPSVDHVRDHLDAKLGDASTQRYFPVSESHAVGLPSDERR